MLKINTKIRKLNFLENLLDILMLPIMYLISGTFERPQQTHFWNNQKLSVEDVNSLDKRLMINHPGLQKANKIIWRWKIPIFHIPIFGGWKDYVVIHSNDEEIEWYIGWISNEHIGFSRIKLNTPVRLLLGPNSVSFFGLKKDGNQIPVKLIGFGQIGDGGQYANLPLL